MLSTMLKYFSIILFAMLVNTSVASAVSVMAWSAFDDKQQEANVYLRKELSSGSIVERQISQGGLNITPTLQVDGSIIWVAWVDRANPEQFDLYYAVLLANSLTLIEMGKVGIQDDHIYSPSLIVTPEGTPWLAWAGVNGKDEDIKISHYENGHWVTERAMTDNEIPDSRPRFEIKVDGGLLLSWEQTTSTAVITKQSEIIPIKDYSLSLSTPSEAMIKYKKRMAQQRLFSPEHRLPAFLRKRKEDVLMGSRVELSE